MIHATCFEQAGWRIWQDTLWSQCSSLWCGSVTNVVIIRCPIALFHLQIRVWRLSCGFIVRLSEVTRQHWRSHNCSPYCWQPHHEPCKRSLWNVDHHCQKPKCQTFHVLPARLECCNMVEACWFSRWKVQNSRTKSAFVIIIINHIVIIYISYYIIICFAHIIFFFIILFIFIIFNHLVHYVLYIMFVSSSTWVWSSISSQLEIWKPSGWWPLPPTNLAWPQTVTGSFASDS